MNRDPSGEGQKKSEDAKSQMLVYIIVGVVSVVFLLAAKLIDKDHTDAASFFTELGMAGIIALIVIFTVEAYTRKQHEKAANGLIERINLNLFHAVYRRHIPDSVFAEVEKCLMHSNVFRSHHEVMYTITPFEEDATGVDCTKHVRCEALSTYSITNVADRPIEHHVVEMLERPIDQAWDDHVKVTEVKIDGKPLSPAQIINASSKTDSQVVFRHPINLKKGEAANISIAAVLVKGRIDQEIWASRYPSDGLKLTVNTPNKGFDVFAHANHSEDLVVEINTPIAKKWVLQYGVFPHQSVTFWWKSK